MSKESVYLYSVKKSKRGGGVAFLRDPKEERIYEPVGLTPSFAEKLSKSLSKVKESSAETGFVVGEFEATVVGDKHEPSHVDWNSVNLNKMTPVEVGFDADNLNHGHFPTSLYGQVATGQVRDMTRDDKLLVVSQGDLDGGIKVFADGRDAFEHGARIPVSNDLYSNLSNRSHLEGGFGLDSEAEIKRMFASKASKQVAGMSETQDHVKEFVALQNVYNVDQYNSTPGDYGNTPLQGSIRDIVDDVKSYRKKFNDKDIDTTFNRILPEDYETMDPEVLQVSDDFHNFVETRQVKRGINPAILGNVFYDYNTIGYMDISGNDKNISDARYNDSRDVDYVKKISYLSQDSLESEEIPYSIAGALHHAKALPELIRNGQKNIPGVSDDLER